MLGQLEIVQVAFPSEDAKQGNNIRLHRKNRLKFCNVIGNFRRGRPCPLHLDGQFKRMAGRIEVDAFLVAARRMLYTGARIFALNFKPSCHQYAKYWFIKHVFTECLIHLAGRKVADIAGKTTLYAIEHISGLGISFSGAGHRGCDAQRNIYDINCPIIHFMCRIIITEISYLATLIDQRVKQKDGPCK